MVLDQVDSTGQVKNSYLVIDDSNLVVFNSTAARLYQDAPPSKKFPTEMFKYVEPVRAVFVGDDWPAVEDFESPEWFDESRDAASRTVLCAQMDTTDRLNPTFDLVTMPEKRAIEASYDAESLQSPKGRPRRATSLLRADLAPSSPSRPAVAARLRPTSSSPIWASVTPSEMFRPSP